MFLIMHASCLRLSRSGRNWVAAHPLNHRAASSAPLQADRGTPPPSWGRSTIVQSSTALVASRLTIAGSLFQTRRWWL